MRGLKEHELGDSQLLHQVFRLYYTNIGMAQFHLNVTADALRGKVILVTGNTATHTHTHMSLVPRITKYRRSKRHWIKPGPTML
jgi:uracil-DNA glycosylase